MLLSSLTFLFSSEKKLRSSLHRILGFYPSNISLYKLAFKHRSAATEKIEGVKLSNERLEYLGDAVLSAVIAHYLFTAYPLKDEGFLTKLRSKIVSRNQLNRLAIKLGLDSYIEKSTDLSIHSSAIYGDAFEALIGAIYLDKGYEVARNFILNRIFKMHLDLEEIEKTETDYKSKLIEWSQKNKSDLRFNLVNEIGEGKEKQFEIEVVINGQAYTRALHYSKKRAEQIAAETSFKQLQNDLN